MLERLQSGESLPLSEFTNKYDPVSRLILENGGILPFAKRMREGGIDLPEVDSNERPMTMVEKLISNKLLGTKGKRGFVKPGDAVLAQVDGGYSHEFTTAQVHTFPPKSMTSILFLTWEVRSLRGHLLYATGVPRFSRFKGKYTTERLQNGFQDHTGVRTILPGWVSPELPLKGKREFIDVGDHSYRFPHCMGGASNALAYELIDGIRESNSQPIRIRKCP